VQKFTEDGADVTTGGKRFHAWRPATKNAWLPTVELLLSLLL